MGPAYDETFTFSTTPGTGKLLIDNSSIAMSSATVWLNGTEEVSPADFAGAPIEKNVTLLTDNTLRIRIVGMGMMGESFILTLTNPTASKAFILLSYGRDGDAGGLGFEADIIYGEF